MTAARKSMDSIVEFFEVPDSRLVVSIVQAKLSPDLSSGVASAAAFQASFGEVAVLEIFDVFLDELGGVKGLGPAGRSREARQAAFQGRFQADGKHRRLARKSRLYDTSYTSYRAGEQAANDGGFRKPKP
jgi:hypothetical protein